MIDHIEQHLMAYIIVSTILSAAATLPFVYTSLSRLRYEKRYRKHLKQSAMAMARLAVFDSWVRAGGRVTLLQEDLERSLRDEYATAAQLNGSDYFETFCQYETDADAALMQVIVSHGLPKGVTNGDPFKEDLCSACDGHGQIRLPHITPTSSKDIEITCHYCAGTGRPKE